MLAFGYVRVSTKEQDLFIQVKAIEEYAKSRGIKLLKIFEDDATSGEKKFFERNGGKKLLEALDLINPDLLIVYSIDRIGRNMNDIINVINFFEEKGIKVISIKEEWLQTLDYNVRKLILNILAWVSEYEKELIKRRREEAWRLGKQKGRPRKIKDEIYIKYYKKYGKVLKLKHIWKIMLTDGYKIDYSTFYRNIKRLKSEGKI